MYEVIYGTIWQKFRASGAYLGHEIARCVEQLTHRPKRLHMLEPLQFVIVGCEKQFMMYLLGHANHCSHHIHKTLATVSRLSLPFESLASETTV